jgi:hypothetical protein
MSKNKEKPVYFSGRGPTRSLSTRKRNIMVAPQHKHVRCIIVRMDEWEAVYIDGKSFWQHHHLGRESYGSLVRKYREILSYSVKEGSKTEEDALSCGQLPDRLRAIPEQDLLPEEPNTVFEGTLPE